MKRVTTGQGKLTHYGYEDEMLNRWFTLCGTGQRKVILSKIRFTETDAKLTCQLCLKKAARMKV